VARDDKAHEGHRLMAEKLVKKLDTVRRVNGTVLYLHERDVDDSVVAEVFGDPALRPLPGVTFLQLQSNPRLTSGGLSEFARVAGGVLPSSGEIKVSYTAVTDLTPLAGVIHEHAAPVGERVNKARPCSLIFLLTHRQAMLG
jgi:hypothetical protein